MRYFFASILAIYIGFSLYSCSEKTEKENDISFAYNPDSVPTVETHNDTIFISDSGIIRYKVISERTLMFDKAAEPCNYFPRGAYLEQYDSSLNVIMTVVADTVWNYSRQKLWKLKGNVRMEGQGEKGKTFVGEEFFWDERQAIIYSNQYMEIHEPDKMTIKASSFKSDETMANYTFRGVVDSDLYIQDEE